jgi:hypothetical protein
MVPIPLELYRPIIRQIRGKRDLCAIARVSRFLQGEAERLIYRQLMATGFNEIVSLCRSVVNTLRVGIYVLEFRIRDDITGDVDPATIHRLLCMALERMVNLRYLSIYASTDAIIPRHFPQTFLPKLSVLGLVCAGSHLEYPSYIVSGRPITHLGVGTMRPGFYSPLSSSIGPVRALYITTCPEYALDLEDLPTAFPDLELFSMATFSRDGVSHTHSWRNSILYTHVRGGCIERQCLHRALLSVQETPSN